MSIFVPNKVYLRRILLHYFIQKKSAAEAHRILVQTYGHNALSDTTCRDWFRRFKNNDFELEDKERSGAPKKFEDKELEQLLDEDPSQTLSELGTILQVDESTVSKRLKGVGMIQKQGHWVPYELKPRDVERRFGTCELLLQRQKRKGFLQRTVALSSMEAEYMAISDATKEAVHLRSFILELSPGSNGKITLYSDNIGAITLAENPVFHNRSKHIDVRHHFVRGIFDNGEIELSYKSTEDMAADILTKGLPGPKHQKCVKSLGLSCDYMRKD
ncbi:MOS1T transposase, partial [Pseudoatta argentina]